MTVNFESFNHGAGFKNKALATVNATERGVPGCAMPQAFLPDCSLERGKNW